MSATVHVIITPVYPAGIPVTFALITKTDYTQVTGGSGGWEIVDRPRQVAATQWYDRSPWQLTLPVRLDSDVIYGNNNTSIELWCALVESWMDRDTSTNQAPVVSVTGPVNGIQRNWCVYSIDMTGTVIRDASGGFRLQQDMTIVLYEYNSPLNQTLNYPSPAIAAAQQINANQGATAYTLYTVNTGDTLAGIAATYLSNWQRWQTIATLNNLRDPTNLTAGQVLKLPIS